MQLQCIFFLASQYFHENFTMIYFPMRNNNSFRKLALCAFTFTSRSTDVTSYGALISVECIQYTQPFVDKLDALYYMQMLAVSWLRFSVFLRGFVSFPCCGDSMDCRRCTNFDGRFCVDASGQHSTKLITLDHRLLCLPVGPNIGFLFGVS